MELSRLRSTAAQHDRGTWGGQMEGGLRRYCWLVCSCLFCSGTIPLPLADRLPLPALVVSSRWIGTATAGCLLLLLLAVQEAHVERRRCVHSGMGSPRARVGSIVRTGWVCV